MEKRYLVRIANTDMEGNRKIGHSLTKIKGISYMMANAILNKLNLDKDIRCGDLSDKDLNEINIAIREPIKYGIPSWMLNRRKGLETGEDSHIITADLDFARSSDIRLMQKIRCYKGIRHMMGQPVRGQRTKSNFRKNKGKVQGVVKKKEVPKEE